MYKKTLLLIGLALSTTLYAQEVDSTTGLIIDKGLSDVKENCTICHTGRFIVVNGGDKEFWKKKLHIMQVAYGLWELDEEAKERLLNYLSKNYSKKVNVSIDK
ncbi:MAG: cytochrome C [Epsilonproteobacteria bacterium]|nr:cytochrome C [Campylobacterota bacterium]